MKIKRLNESLIDDLNSLPSEKGMSKVNFELVKQYQSILNQFPIGTVLKHHIEAGEEKFTKVEDGEYGWWEHFRAPWKITQRTSEFDLAHWLAGRANITRSNIIQENLNDMKIKKLNEAATYTTKELKEGHDFYYNPENVKGSSITTLTDYLTYIRKSMWNEIWAYEHEGEKKNLTKSEIKKEIAKIKEIYRPQIELLKNEIDRKRELRTNKNKLEIDPAILDTITNYIKKYPEVKQRNLIDTLDELNSLGVFDIPSEFCKDPYNVTDSEANRYFNHMIKNSDLRARFKSLDEELNESKSIKTFGAKAKTLSESTEDYDESEDAEYISIDDIKEVAKAHNYYGDIDAEIEELGDDPDTLERIYSDIVDVGTEVMKKQLGEWRFLLQSETDYDEPVIETENGYYAVSSRGSIALVPVEEEDIFYLDESIKTFGAKARKLNESEVLDYDAEYERIDRSGTDDERLIAAVSYMFGVDMNTAKEYIPDLGDTQRKKALAYYDLRGLPHKVRIEKIKEMFPRLRESADYKVKFFQVFEAPKSPTENGKMIGQRGSLEDANAFGKEKAGEGNYIIKAVCDDGQVRNIDNDTKSDAFQMVNESKESWDSARVIDLVRYYLDRGNPPINTLANQIMNQMKEEGSTLPTNMTDFFDKLYTAIDNYESESLEEDINVKKFNVGDTFNYSGLYGGSYDCKITDIKDDKVYVTVNWTAEDTGKEVSDTETFDIERDENGNEKIVVWEYHGEKGYVYPESNSIEESLKDYRFEVSCNDGPTKIVRTVAENDDKAVAYAKHYYAQEHTTYADDRQNKWSIRNLDETLQENINVEDYPFMFQYTCNNSTFGYDFQRFAHELGAKKMYGLYKGKGQGTHFYVVPSEDVYNQLKDVAKKRFNVEMYRLRPFNIEDYPNAKEDALNEASYGGAFDIEDDQLFTREDIENASEEVIDHINETFEDKFQLGGTWFENGEWVVNVQTEDGMEEYEEKVKVDSRKIRNPFRDLKEKYALELAAKLINKIKEEKYPVNEAVESSDNEFDDDVKDLSYYYDEDDIIDALTDVWEEVASKQVEDSDGFMTDYTMYRNINTGEYVFVFGDKDLYRPEDGNFDWECETEEEAQEWFNTYSGFAFDEE